MVGGPMEGFKFIRNGTRLRAMKEVRLFEKIYLYRGAVDFRKSINGLSRLVQMQMKLDPWSEALFLFCNTRRDKMKALYWDKTGFALWYKRLEKEKFAWPKLSHHPEAIELESQQLAWLLEGYEIWKMKAHQNLSYKTVF